MDIKYNNFHNYPDVKKEVTTGDQEITVSTNFEQQQLVKHEINVKVEDEFYHHNDIKLEEPQIKIEPCPENLLCNFKILENERSSMLEKPYQCTYCDKGFYNVSMLIEHQKGHLVQHQRINYSENPHDCTSCGQCFTTNDQLIQHKKTHKIQCIYECRHCDKSFTRIYHLKIHQEIHTDTEENPFKCIHCNKGFRWRYIMLRHLKLNMTTMDKPLHCRHCTKSFIAKCQLKKHTLSHFIENPFQCSSCDSSFTRKGNLIKHEREHNENPYKCHHCDTYFLLKFTMQRHIKDKHANPGEATVL